MVIAFSAVVILRSRSTIDTMTSTSSQAIEKALFGELRQKQELSTRVLAAALTNPVYQFQLQVIATLISAVEQNSDVLYVYVYDTKGVIIHDGTKELLLYGKALDDDVGQQALATRQLVSQTKGDTLYVAMPIMLQDELLGGVEVSFSLKGIKADIAKRKNYLADQYNAYRQRELLSIIILAAVFTVLGVISAFLLARSWSQPLSLLSALTTRVGRGEYDVDIPITRSDEIGQLAASFRGMVGNLKALRQKEERQTKELNQAYGQVQKFNEDLLRANKAKDEFLSVMSHELRTPLNVIMGYSQMMKEGILGEVSSEQRRALEKVMTRSQDLLGMISEILQATSIEAGAVKLEMKEVPLREFLDDLRSAYEVPISKDLSFAWNYPPDLGRITTDSAKLKHILQNLINNAIKFTDEGHITVSARLCPETRAAEFRVADTGIGIDERMLPSIFERFRQLDSTETRTHGGVGIGLYIVKEYTELLGGKIKVESEPGRGSTFTVTMPG